MHISERGILLTLFATLTWSNSTDPLIHSLTHNLFYLNLYLGNLLTFKYTVHLI